ncbi:MAG: hypothetical protein R2737_03835 [Candidatus Nanopelagicales bacterium]
MTSTGGTAAEGGLRIQARVAGVGDGDALLLEYEATNVGPGPLLVCDVWPADQGAETLRIDPLGSMVSFAPGPVVVVERSAPDRGDDVAVEVPWCPLGRYVDPGATVTGTVGLPLPARAHDPYHPVLGPAVGARTRVPVVRLVLGWLPAAGLSPELVPQVATDQGPLAYVKVAPWAFSRSSVDVPFEVPALIPRPARTWVCGSCGATNVGEQPACLRCGQPAWRPTHTVPAGGATWYSLTDRSPGGTLDAGLEVAVVERVGDWARITAANGWTGWVDARLLRPL